MTTAELRAILYSVASECCRLRISLVFSQDDGSAFRLSVIYLQLNREITTMKFRSTPNWTPPRRIRRYGCGMFFSCIEAVTTSTGAGSFGRRQPWRHRTAATGCERTEYLSHKWPMFQSLEISRKLRASLNQNLDRGSCEWRSNWVSWVSSVPCPNTPKIPVGGIRHITLWLSMDF